MGDNAWALAMPVHECKEEAGNIETCTEVTSFTEEKINNNIIAIYIIVSTNDSMARDNCNFCLRFGVSQLSLSKSALVSMAISLHNF